MAMAATAQLSKAGWESLNEEMRAYLSDVVMGSLPKDYIIDLTISICSIKSDGRIPNYNFETIDNKIILTDETEKPEDLRTESHDLSGHMIDNGISVRTPPEELLFSSDTSPSQLKKPRLEPSFSESHVKDLVNEMLRAKSSADANQGGNEDVEGAHHEHPFSLMRTQSDNITTTVGKNNDQSLLATFTRDQLMNSLSTLQSNNQQTENMTTNQSLPMMFNQIPGIQSPLNFLTENLQKVQQQQQQQAELNDDGSEIQVRSIKIEDPNQPPPTGPGPYRRRHIWMCSVCGVKKPTKQQVDMHTAVHSDVRPFKCIYPFCGKAFKTKLVLQRHQQCHEDKLERTLKSKLKNLAKSHQEQRQQITSADASVFQQIQQHTNILNNSVKNLSANNLNISATLADFYGNEENIPKVNNGMIHPSILDNSTKLENTAEKLSPVENVSIEHS